jgi:hypothetical protein
MIARMEQDKTALERAFEIAASGARTMDDVRRQLKAEGYDQSQLEGRTLTAQLMDIMRKAGEKAGRS